MTIQPFPDQLESLRRTRDTASVRGTLEMQKVEEQIAELEAAATLACPQCGRYEDLTDVTMYPGLCDGKFWRDAHGKVDFEPSVGETEIVWDAGKLADDPVQCSCGWVGKRAQLVEAKDEDEDDPYPCEDCDVNGRGACRTHGEATLAAMHAIYTDPDRTLAVLKASGLA